MSVQSGQSITCVFTTRRFDTGAATNGDSTPTGTLYVNGVSNAASVTVTNVTTGVYKAAVTLPTLAVGDVVDLRISATVNSVTDNAVVWRDTKDLLIDASGKTSPADGSITDATITLPAEAAGRPATFLAVLRRAWEWVTNKVTRERTTGVMTLYGSDNTTVLETRTQSTTDTLDAISKGA